MSQNAYAVALKSALTEVKKLCPDVSCSFIFTKDGNIIAEDQETAEETIKKMMNSFQNIVKKEDIIGGLQTLIINGEKGKVHISYISDMYLVLAISKEMDATFLRAITHVIFPTVLKLLENVAPAPLQLSPPKQLSPPEQFSPSEQLSSPEQLSPPKQLALSKQLIVDTFSGFFAGDSVKVDLELLKQWSELLKQKTIDKIEIESFNGKATQCKVKEISEKDMQGKGIIRIPEKICKTLEVKKGEVVRVKPIETEEKIDARQKQV